MGASAGFPIDPNGLFGAVADYWHTQVLKDAQVHARVPRRYELDSGAVGSVQREDGVEVLKALNRCLDEFWYNGEPLDRTQDQVDMHRMMAAAWLVRILGPEYDQYAHRYIQELGRQDLPQELLMSAMRRAGKSMGTAVYAAAYILTVPRANVVIFSVAQRAAQNLLQMIEQLVKGHERGQNMMIRPHTQQILTLQGPHGPTDKRSVKSFPGRNVDVSAPRVHCRFIFERGGKCPTHTRHQYLFVY